MPNLLDQIQSFILTLLVGVLVGLIIHYYQLTIRKSRLNKYFLYFIDFILWILIMGVIVICLLLINMGEMRIYVILALLAGILVYHRYLARCLSGPLTTAARATRAFIFLVKKNAGRPLARMAAAVSPILHRGQDNPPDGPG